MRNNNKIISNKRLKVKPVTDKTSKLNQHANKRKNVSPVKDTSASSSRKKAKI